MNMKKTYFISFLLMAVISCKQEYTTNETARDSNTAKKVRLAKTALRAEIHTIVASGVLSSKEEVLLSFKTGGIVQQLNAEEGDLIAKGNQLGQLNLAEINAQVKAAKNAVEKAKRDLKRINNLYQDTAATLEQKQNTETALEIARSNYEIAQFNLQYSTIKAPIQGKVLHRFVEVGELVAPGQPIYKVASSGTERSQILRIGLADKDIVKVQLKDTAIVRFDALPEQEFTATVTEIAEAAKARTGLFEVELSLTAFSSVLKNGFVGKINLIPNNGEQRCRIPMNALVEGKGKEAVIFYTTNQQTVQQAKVQVQNIGADYFTVAADGLPKNAQIISEGAPYLTINDTIQILP